MWALMVVSCSRGVPSSVGQCAPSMNEMILLYDNFLPSPFMNVLYEIYQFEIFVMVMNVTVMRSISLKFL